MSREFSKEQVKDYIDSGGKCPFCSTLNTCAGERCYDGAKLYWGVSCVDCEAEWTEEYILADVHLDSLPRRSPIEELVRIAGER